MALSDCFILLYRIEYKYLFRDKSSERYDQGCDINESRWSWQKYINDQISKKYC